MAVLCKWSPPGGAGFPVVGVATLRLCLPCGDGSSGKEAHNGWACANEPLNSGSFTIPYKWPHLKKRKKKKDGLNELMNSYQCEEG